MVKRILLPFFLTAILMSCTHNIESKNQIELAPIEIKPIHITLDINIKVQVDKELDDFFGDLDK